MSRVDYELILGMKKDPQFGSVIVFGRRRGAEGLADFAVDFRRSTRRSRRRMMESTIYQAARAATRRDRVAHRSASSRRW